MRTRRAGDYIAHLITEHGNDGKICGVQSIRSPWNYPEEMLGKYLLVWETSLSSTHKQESISSIHNVGKLEVKGSKFKANCNVGSRSCKGHSLFKIHVLHWEEQNWLMNSSKRLLGMAVWLLLSLGACSGL